MLPCIKRTRTASTDTDPIILYHMLHRLVLLVVDAKLRSLFLLSSSMGSHWAVGFWGSYSCDSLSITRPGLIHN